MVTSEAEKFVQNHREELTLIAENGSETGKKIAQAFLTCVPESNHEKGNGG